MQIKFYVVARKKGKDTAVFGDRFGEPFTVVANATRSMKKRANSNPGYVWEVMEIGK